MVAHLATSDELKPISHFVRPEIHGDQLQPPDQLPNATSARRTECDPGVLDARSVHSSEVRIEGHHDTILMCGERKLLGIVRVQ
jgi:hypothetical protein